MRCILEEVTVVLINPLFATGWKYGHAHFCQLPLVLSRKLCKIHFTIESYHSFKKKVGCTGVLSREHTAHVVVAGLDKATISMHYYCNGPCGYRSRVADSRVQRLNHWAIKVPERPSRLRLAGSLHYSPLFEIRAPWLGPLSTKAGSFHSQANPGYRCHQCNGPCGYRSRVADSRVQRLNHWAIKVPERPSRLRLAGSLHYLAMSHSPAIPQRRWF